MSEKELVIKSGRKVLLIDPKFQLRFLSFTMGILIIVMVTLYISISIFFANFRNLALDLGIEARNPLFYFLHTQQSKMNLLLGILFLVLTLIFLIWGLFVSHRIAGPIYRLKKELIHYLETGKQKKIFLREKDYFSDLADLISKVINK